MSIAVVVPCYELGRTVVEAVDSVIAQTRPPDELVVVDDGSRDPYTRSVLNALANDGVRVLFREHRGVAAARNAGIASTKAPLLLLLDADDIVEPTYIEKACSVLERSEADFVSCPLRAFGDASYVWVPPAPSVAAGFARGGLHISTIFRREMWERTGGFDTTLPAYEDADFWLSAIELGFRGEMLEEPLVRYRVRRGSRYQAALTPHVYRESRRRIIEKHLDALIGHGAEVFVSQLEFESDLRNHARHLRNMRDDVTREIDTLQEEIADAQAALAAVGDVPLDWGELVELCARHRETSTATLYASYVDGFLGAVSETELGKTLRVNHRDGWPVEPEGDYDSIILVDVLAGIDEPRAALAQCRPWLTPTGRVLATFPCVPALSQSNVRRGFTEASVRALLTATFPDAAVSIETHGNLLTCIAAVAGVPDDTLKAADIVDADPWQPLLVTARVELGGDGRSDGIARFRSTRRIRDRGVVLAYHRVAELAPDVHGLCVPPDRFRQHMELLRERFSPVSLTDLVEGVNDRDLPHRSVCVTFDDGYADNFLVASPILSELEIPATFFFNSETLDGSEPWWDTIERVLLAEAELPDQLRVQTRGLVLDLPTVTDAERRHALLALHGGLLELDVEERRNVVESVSAWAGNSLPPRDSHRLMTAEEIRELAQRPNHEIGAHTVHHLMLTKYATDVRYQELVDNRNVLEALSGRPVSTLSYPYGATDSVTADLVHELGFSYALTVESGAVTQDSDPLRLPRLEIGPPRPHDFELEITQIFAKA